MGFFEELKRRNVIRVGGAYVIVAWLLMQVAEVFAPALHLPEWFTSGVAFVVLLGFPLALFFAWAYELTPEGIRKEKDVDRARSATGSTGRKLDFTIIALLVLALAYFAYDKYMSTPGGGSPAREQLREAATAEPAAVEASPGLQKSIAILPFATRSGEATDAYFSQGIHDDLLTQLAKIEDLRVISRTSVMQFAGTTKTIREIANELGVATVMEGGIQRAGDRVRVNAQLIEAASDTHLWAESWDKELTASNIFEIQSELAMLIAQALKSELAPGVQKRIEDKPTANLEAYDLTLRGRYLMDKEMTEDNLDGAAELFRQAIATDPEYATAWAGLSQALQELVGWHYRPEKELWPAAWKAAERAVELDPNNTEALMALGDLQRMERQYAEGERTFLRAIELSPGSADAHSRYSDLLRDARRFDESVREARRAVELDPRLMRIRESLLQNIYFDRQFHAVIQEARTVIEMEPDAAGGWYWLSLAQVMTGQPAKAESAMRKAIDLDPGNPYYAIGLAYVHARAGRRQEALAILEGDEAERFSLVEISLVHGALGEMDLAFEYLDRALDDTPAALYYIAADPAADPMRRDMRWQVFITRLEEAR